MGMGLEGVGGLNNKITLIKPLRILFDECGANEFLFVSILSEMGYSRK